MSLKFKEPTIDDKEWVQKILSQEKSVSSDSVFGTYYLWSHYYSTQICKYENMLIKKIGGKNISYGYPKGARSSKDLIKAMDAIINDAKENGHEKITLTDLSDSEVQKTEEVFPQKFEFTPIRDNFEYIYSVRDLALLHGKKYHSKRNHISRFSKTFDWSYRPTVPADKNKYLSFFEKWFESFDSEKPFKELDEYKAIKKALENYEKLELSGGITEVDGVVVACTIGEKINDDVFLVHFEKALSEFRGAYSVINNAFCKTLLGKYELINREEDLGIPGLRKAKLSYLPTVLLPKYKAVLKA